MLDDGQISSSREKGWMFGSPHPHFLVLGSTNSSSNVFICGLIRGQIALSFTGG